MLPGKSDGLHASAQGSLAVLAMTGIAPTCVRGSHLPPNVFLWISIEVEHHRGFHQHHKLHHANKEMARQPRNQ